MSELSLVAPDAPPKWTERAVLDALHRRFCPPVNGPSPRYALAEHLRNDPTWAGVILDAVTVDTWGSTGYALDGYEIKVSRGDLRREVENLAKSQAWDDILDSFSIVAPKGVLHDWQTFGMPEAWGVLSLADSGALRWLRKPTSTPGSYGMTRPVDRRVVASIARSVAKTSTTHCARLGCKGAK